MFWKKRQVEDAVLGILTYHDGEWISELLPSSCGAIRIGVEGSKAAPSSEGISDAREAFVSPAWITEAARAYLLADAQAVEMMQGHGELTLDGFSFTSTRGVFSVTYGLTGWPDAMLVIEFSQGVPCEVSLSD